MVKTVSEKTLELNLCAEVLALVRASPGGAGAFWIGMRQDQEARNGIDELLANLPPGVHLALQFKAPYATRPNRVPYRFSLNDRQHALLSGLASRRPSAVHYVLPHYNTLPRLRSSAPNLLSNTYSMAVASIRLPTSLSGRHRLDSEPAPTYAVTIYSDPIPGHATPLARAISEHWRLREREWLSTPELRWWFRRVLRQEENPAVLGQLMRGFRLLSTT